MRILRVFGISLIPEGCPARRSTNTAVRRDFAALFARSRTFAGKRASGTWETDREGQILQGQLRRRARLGRGRRRTSLEVLRICRRPGRPSQGWLFAGPLALPVALGRGGIRADKREGDGATPRGSFRALRLWWRADRLLRPPTSLPIRRIASADAW